MSKTLKNAGVQEEEKKSKLDIAGYFDFYTFFLIEQNRQHSVRTQDISRMR